MITDIWACLESKQNAAGALDYGSMPQMKRKRNGLHSGSSGILKTVTAGFPVRCRMEKMIVFLFEEITVKDREFWLHECAKKSCAGNALRACLSQRGAVFHIASRAAGIYLTVAAVLENSNGNEGTVFCKTWDSFFCGKENGVPFKLEEMVFRRFGGDA